MSVKIEYPKCIYREDNSFTVVRDVETENKLKPYFNCEKPDHSKPFIELSLESALSMLTESKEEAQEAVSKRTRRKKTLPASEDQIDIINGASDGDNR